MQIHFRENLASARFSFAKTE